MIEYTLEELSDDFIAEWTPILDKHRQELQSFKDMQLNPNWDMYRTVESMGNLVLIVARDTDDGCIVGYCMFIIHPNPHYSDFLYGTEDVFYVVEDKRGSRIAVTLIKKSEEILKARGVDTIVHHAKFSNTFAQFLEKLGYHKTEVMLAKRFPNA